MNRYAFIVHCIVSVELRGSRDPVHQEDVSVVFNREEHSWIPAFYEVPYYAFPEINYVLRNTVRNRIDSHELTHRDRIAAIKEIVTGRSYFVDSIVVSSRHFSTDKEIDEHLRGIAASSMHAFFPVGYWKKDSPIRHLYPRELKDAHV